MKSVLYKYTNGNAIVSIFNDGTRIVGTKDDEFNFDFPMNMDIKITNFCNKGCPMCHENSNPEGKHAPFENFKFIESWHEGCEAALGGGMVTSYPEIDKLLVKLKDHGIIANATFQQDELVENFDRIKKWQQDGLLKGIGVSVSHGSDKFVEYVKELNNVVFHVIAGLGGYETFQYLLDNFSSPKVLILGYKHFRRGITLYEKMSEDIDERIAALSENIDWLCKQFEVVSFDNLALEQLHVKGYLTQKQWDIFYQGDEGESNMYIDAVEGVYATNSTSCNRYSLKEDIKEMFDSLK